MEHLALGLVWLPGMLVSVSPMFQQVHMMAMDMAPYSFDDQYKGCSQMMEKELKKLNRTEFVPNSNYANAWKAAAAEWQKRGSQSSALKPEQEIALMTYTLESQPLYQEFTVALGQAGYSREQYLNNFHFKVLHFLLMEALRALREAQHGQCYYVYQWVKGVVVTAQRGQSVRLGPLTSMSRDKSIAKKVGDGTIISVKTCYGVPIKAFSVKDEVLIPPFETFKVTSFTQVGNKARIDLQSHGVYSKYNCEYVKEKRCKNQPCDFRASELRDRRAAAEGTPDPSPMPSELPLTAFLGVSPGSQRQGKRGGNLRQDATTPPQWSPNETVSFPPEE